MGSYDEDTGAYDNINRDKDKDWINEDTGSTGSREGGSSGGGGGGGNRGGRGGGNNNEGPQVWGEGGRGGPEITAGGGGGGTSGGTSYSSGYGYSSSSGGSSSGMSSRDARLLAQGESLYYQLWGEYPASGYIKALVKKGMNIFEIEDHERRKPAFKKTDTYQNEYTAYAKMVSRLMGTR